MSSNYRDLTQGNIFRQLVTLAIPIMATSFMQMAYNLTDLVWIGRLGSGAVAAVGTAGFFVWFGNALLLSTKIGAEVNVSQSLGQGNTTTASGFGGAALKCSFIMSLCFGIIILISAVPLMNFFHLSNIDGYNVSANGVIYLRIIGAGAFSIFLNPTFTGIFNGLGDSKTPFKVNTAGLLLNLVLDPLMIFGAGPLPALGTAGAAAATVISNILVSLIFIFILSRKTTFNLREMLKHASGHEATRIMKIGLPVSAQNALFSVFAMILARILAVWGPIPIAVQRVGSQIEAITWMTASGISTALGAFVGQNFGAGQPFRIKNGYATAMGIMSIFGIGASFLLIFAGEPVFSLFLSESRALAEGIIYLRILGYSQLFMALEITTAGAFNGMGRTFIPAAVSIVFTGFRIPAALFLAGKGMGVNAVWWSVSGTSVIKGTLLVILFLIFIKKYLLRFYTEKVKILQK